MLINENQILIGDEIIISAYSNLKYLKILRLPIKDNGSFKCSVYRHKPNWLASCEQDVDKHNTVIYQNLYGRNIWLVKRETN
jgi:hypothetical protein